MTLRPRIGASLAATLAALILIECVILGTLHLAMAERRVASAATDLLRLRLAADAALAEAALLWPAAASDLERGADLIVLDVPAANGLRTRAVLRHLGIGLYLLRATAADPPPGVGHAAATMLLLPPLLPPQFRAQAAADAATAMLAEPGSPLPPDLDSVLIRALDGRHRLMARPGVLLLDDANAVVDGPFQGVVLASGNLLLRAGARVTGVVFAGGTLTVEDGVTLRGAWLARALAVDGALRDTDTDAAEHALAAAGLRRPDPAPGRFRLPGF